MQSVIHTMQSSLAELAGWALILVGLAVATLALAGKSVPRLVSFGGLARSRFLPAVAPTSTRRIGPANEWQRLKEIAEQEFCGVTKVADFHTRAREEIAAADQAVSQLLADCAGSFMPSETGATPQDREPDCQPAPVRVPDAPSFAA